MANNENPWTPSEVDLLINLVRENQEIYDQSCPGYSNLTIMDNLWRSIGTRFPDRNEQQLRKKWQILRTGYRSRRSCKHPSGTGAKQTKKWPYLESLRFLEKYLSERATTSNVSQTNAKTPINFAAPSTSTAINIDAPSSSRINLSSIFESGRPADDFEVIETDEDYEAPFSPAPQMTSSSDSGESQMGGNSGTGEPHTPGGGKGVKRKRQNLNPVDEKLIAYLEERRTPKKQKSSDELFLASLLEDMDKLSPRKLRKFKLDMLNHLNELLDE